MKKLYLLLSGTVLFFMNGMGQTDSTKQISPTSDTIRVGSIIIVKEKLEKRTGEAQEKEKSTHRSHWKNNVSTNWFIVDIGFANHNDLTNYNSPEAKLFVQGTTSDKPAAKNDFTVKSGSFNFNLWLFMQRMSLYRQVINLKYGAGIELYKYYYKSDIRYVEGFEPFVERQHISFRKNKFAFDYVSVPLMLNINPQPRHKNSGINVSAGVSAGYLYGARNKQRSSEFGKEKFSGDFNLKRWKFAYLAEIGLGPVQLYGSYAITPLHQYGVDQHPYAIGLRFSNW